MCANAVHTGFKIASAMPASWRARQPWRRCSASAAARRACVWLVAARRPWRATVAGVVGADVAGQGAVVAGVVRRRAAVVLHERVALATLAWPLLTSASGSGGTGLSAFFLPPKFGG